MLKKKDFRLEKKKFKSLKRYIFFFNINIINIFLIIRYLKIFNLNFFFLGLLKYKRFNKLNKKIKYLIIFQNLMFFLKKIKYFICMFKLYYKFNLFKKQSEYFELNELNLQKNIFIIFEKLYNCKFKLIYIYIFI